MTEIQSELHNSYLSMLSSADEVHKLNEQMKRQVINYWRKNFLHDNYIAEYINNEVTIDVELQVVGSKVVSIKYLLFKNGNLYSIAETNDDHKHSNCRWFIYRAGDKKPNTPKFRTEKNKYVIKQLANFIG